MMSRLKVAFSFQGLFQYGILVSGTVYTLLYVAATMYSVLTEGDLLILGVLFLRFSA